jgi:NHLM bacteriocin system ABC transporter peptidase/ATP-binding protein
VPLERLRIACGVSRDGSKAANILRAARAYGLDAQGMQMEPGDLSLRIAPPAILFWEFNHFVVWEGTGRRFGRRAVFVNDPKAGRRVLDPKEFGDSFTGIVLVMSPGAKFRRGGRRLGMLAGLLSRMRGTGGAVAVALIASLLLVPVGVLEPVLTRVFIDTILPGDTSVLLPFSLLMGVTAVVAALLTWLQQEYALRAHVVGSTVNSARFFRHLLRLPVTFFAQRGPAELARRLRSHDGVAATLVRSFAPAIVHAVVVVAYAVVLWTYDPQLTLLGVGVALLNVVVLRAVMIARESSVFKMRWDVARFYSTSFNSVQLIETIKAAGAETEFFRRWAGHQVNVLNDVQSAGAPAAALSTVAPLLAALNSAAILLIGGLRVVDGHLSIGLLVAFQALVAGFTGPVTELTLMANEVQDLGADLAMLRDVENFPPDRAIRRREDRRSISSFRPPRHLTVDRVTFGYSPLEKPLLRDVSFEVGPGQMVAVVGASGSGKSTLAKVICGLYEPWQGEVLFDGYRRTEIPRALLANSMAFVDQDIVLFEGTVRDNVALRDPSIGDEAVVAALRNAAMYEWVASRPGGVHSLVAQDARNLSGGQRQRLEIARALVRKPNILVLDEATSALDGETEAIVTDNLRRLGCACVVVAHRLSTVRDSDEILFLEAGRVVERGRHAELIAAGGAYAELVRDH